MNIHERVERLHIYPYTACGDLVRKSDVLAILWEEVKCLRCDGTKAAVGKYLCPPGSISEHRFVDQRKGQRRVKLGRRGRDSGVRRLGVERRGEG